jgi:hypothetical protein
VITDKAPLCELFNKLQAGDGNKHSIVHSMLVPELKVILIQISTSFEPSLRNPAERPFSGPRRACEALVTPKPFVLS